MKSLRIFLTAASLLVTAASAQATTIERVVSPGGIEAWLVREPAIPLIAMDFAFEGGSSLDPAGKPGVANMAAALLDEGAGDLDSNAFQRRLADTAVELRFTADRDNLRGSVKMLKATQDEGFRLLQLALNAPRFDAEPVARTRSQILAGLRRESTSPGEIAGNLWWRTAFPNHPYGQPPKGTLDSVAQINAADVHAHIRRALARDRLKIAVVGDIDAASLGPVIDKVFGSLPAKAPADARLPEGTVAMTGAGRRTVVDLDVPQSVIVLGGSGLPRQDVDFIPAFVVNHILGGGSFSSRLYTEIREKRGLAYGVYSYLYPLDHAALFMGSTQTRGDRTGEALDIIEKEIVRMAAEGPSAAELQEAKDYLKGSYALRFDTSTKIAAQLLQIQLDDLGIDYIQKRNGLIDAVTIADAKRAAARLGPGGLLVTIVGRPKGVTSSGAAN